MLTLYSNLNLNNNLETVWIVTFKKKSVVDEGGRWVGIVLNLYFKIESNDRINKYSDRF